MMNTDEKPSAAIIATSNSAEDGHEETDANAIIEALRTRVRELESTIQELSIPQTLISETATKVIESLYLKTPETTESNPFPTTSLPEENLVFLGDNGNISIHKDDYHGLCEFYRRLGIRVKDIKNKIQDEDGRGCFSVSGEERRVCKFECSDKELSTYMSLPFELRKRMDGLTHLTLKAECTMLPGNVGEALRYITHLDLERVSSVRSIPSGIKSLQNLQVFDLSFSYIMSLPEEIGQLANLKILNFADCSRLLSLPSSIENLQNLEMFDLSHTYISSLPEGIGQLANLNILRLRGSRLQSLPSSIGKLKNLEELDLSWTRIQSLPEEIGELTNLKTLDLDGSLVQSLPSSIENLQNLKYLGANAGPNMDLSEDPAAFLLAITKSLRFLGDLKYNHTNVTAEGKGKIALQLACNRARFRTQSMRTKPELWPSMLCNAPKAFDAYDKWNDYKYSQEYSPDNFCPEKPTCIYNILAEGMGGLGYFIEIIEKRN